jgi:propanediol utilization protein
MRSSAIMINNKQMKNIKQLGIWMDHSNAYLMELTNEIIVTNRVALESTNNEAEFNFYKGEKLIHKKEQHLQLSYYRKIGEVIKKYQDVVLFGPTDAKNELINLVKTDHLFEGIRIEVKNSGKMTEDQMQTFIREYFK